MSKIAIRAFNLGKQYEAGGPKGSYRTLRDSITDIFPRRGKGRSKSDSRFWALDHVTFEVPAGESVGIIGRNGAGKSTLLKVLSQVTDPTSGWAEINGRLSSLLEVGAGFHPELTGRENIFLSGAILGMKNKAIRSTFDEIVAFSELDKFIDTPVKHYSSGMHLRLGFAVGAHLETDILLLDEVLAVGDVHFQAKCMDKIREICRKGRTILFVSHNMGLIRQLCSRALLIRAGALGAFGPCDEVVQAYLAQNSRSDLSELLSLEDRKGAGAIRIRSVRFEGPDGREMPDLVSGQACRIILALSNSQPHQHVQACVAFLNEMNERIMYLNSWFNGVDIDSIEANGELVCEIPRMHLAPGRYALEVWVKSAEVMQDRISDIGPVNVSPGDFYGTGICATGLTEKVLMDFNWNAQTQHDSAATSVLATKRRRREIGAERSSG